jgi:hypothetical protein
MVCQASLLPRLAAWDKSKALAAGIMYAVEGQMQGCAFTLGLGEHNLTGKPVLEYDHVVRPHELHVLKPAPEPRSPHLAASPGPVAAAPRRRLPCRRFCQPLSSVGAGVISGGRLVLECENCCLLKQPVSIHHLKELSS